MDCAASLQPSVFWPRNSCPQPRHRSTIRFASSANDTLASPSFTRVRGPEIVFLRWRRERDPAARRGPKDSEVQTKIRRTLDKPYQYDSCFQIMIETIQCELGPPAGSSRLPTLVCRPRWRPGLIGLKSRARSNRPRRSDSIAPSGGAWPPRQILGSHVRVPGHNAAEPVLATTSSQCLPMPPAGTSVLGKIRTGELASATTILSFYRYFRSHQPNALSLRASRRASRTGISQLLSMFWRHHRIGHAKLPPNLAASHFSAFINVLAPIRVVLTQPCV